MVFSDTILITVMNTVEQLNPKSCSIKTVQCSMFDEILLEVCRRLKSHCNDRNMIKSHCNVLYAGTLLTIFRQAYYTMPSL